jgi:hypothetical protein
MNISCDEVRMLFYITKKKKKLCVKINHLTFSSGNFSRMIAFANL